METWIYIIISIVAGLAAGCVLMKLFAARKETQLGVACAKAEAQAGLLAEQLAAAVGLEIYGGDCIVCADGTWYMIDFNDWPSFSRCREEAADAIAGLI